jgi:hypothetical protein
MTAQPAKRIEFGITRIMVLKPETNAVARNRMPEFGGSGVATPGWNVSRRECPLMKKLSQRGISSAGASGLKRGRHGGGITCFLRIVLGALNVSIP